MNRRDQNRFLQRLKQRKKIRAERKAGIKPYRKRFLIVAEGKTECQYFSQMNSILLKGTVFLELLTTSREEQKIVQIAKERREEQKRKAEKNPLRYQEYDEVWAVFDKDDFPDERFNQAIADGRNNGIHCAYSNRCFELWLLLHFHVISSGLTPRQYRKGLTEKLGKNYNKSDSDIYSLVSKKGSEKEAIHRAKSLYNQYDHSSPARENPSTTVYQLVAELLEYKER